MTFAEAHAQIEAAALTDKERRSMHIALKAIYKNATSTLEDDEPVANCCEVHVRNEPLYEGSEIIMRYVSLNAAFQSKLYYAGAAVLIGPRGGRKWAHTTRYLGGRALKFYK